MASRKGSPNKNKAFLLTRLQEMYGEDFHPIMNMAKNAVTIQKQVDTLGPAAEIADLMDANRAWEAIAQYVEPKLKAVELNVGEDTRIKVQIVDLTGDNNRDTD